MDPFTNTDPRFQSARLNGRRPMPLAAGEVAEYRREREGVLDVVARVTGYFFLLVVAVCVGAHVIERCLS